MSAFGILAENCRPLVDLIEVMFGRIFPEQDGFGGRSSHLSGWIQTHRGAKSWHVN